jgi:hypothetical protein
MLPNPKKRFTTQEVHIGDRIVTIEVDNDTGDVMVVGAPRVMVHFSTARQEGQLFFTDKKHAGSLVSFRCEVAPDGKSVSAKVLTGPTPAWKHGACPELKVEAGLPPVSDEVTLIVSANNRAGDPGERFLLREALWKE